MCLGLRNSSHRSPRQTSVTNKAARMEMFVQRQLDVRPDDN